MNIFLDLHDVQGNIMKNYADFGYVKARYLFFRITRSVCGRRFISRILPLITNSTSWTGKNSKWPEATTNISFTYNGLKQLGLPVESLRSFPEEFIMGMRGRRSILGDDGSSDPMYWDEVYKKEIHIFVSMEARDTVALEKRFNDIMKLCSDLEGVELLDGHRSQAPGQSKCYQDASVLYENGIPTAREHFGFVDGISNPFFKGMTTEMGQLVGGGKKSGVDEKGYGDPMHESTWEPLETGEFILGHKDEAMEYPAAPMPPLLAKNGSYMVFRKLHENVGKFNAYLEKEARRFPGGKEVLAAKFAGRWRNGAPITLFPNEADANLAAASRQLAIYNMSIARTDEEKRIALENFNAVNRKFTGFDFHNDIEGSRCPVGSHIRRTNPRGSLEYGNKNAFETPTALENRRRIIRRGLPYGIADSPESNDGEHGTIFMAINASIKRQFEFVLQQWVNYGNDFRLANDKDPILGNHREQNGIGEGRMVIQGSREDGIIPNFMGQIPRFVETRGGEYFFIPSFTALRLISEGIVDPT